MIDDPDLVTTTALDRFKANRRPFLFRDRFGHTQRLQHDVGKDRPYSAHNTTTRTVWAFQTLPELRRHLKETA